MDRKERKFQIEFAERMAQLPPYMFGMINKMKMEKRWAGDDVIDLGMGNPMDSTPELVTRKLIDVVSDPKTHRYPVAGGMKNLKREIALYYQRNYGVELAGTEDIICTIGSKEGLSHLCLALLGPGDTVITPAPAFPIHVYSAVIAGANVLRIPICEEKEFLRQISKMCQSLYPPPKLLMLNFPHNPTGELVSREFFAEVVQLAKKWQAGGWDIVSVTVILSAACPKSRDTTIMVSSQLSRCQVLSPCVTVNRR